MLGLPLGTRVREFPGFEPDWYHSDAAFWEVPRFGCCKAVDVYDYVASPNRRSIFVTRFARARKTRFVVVAEQNVAPFQRGACVRRFDPAIHSEIAAGRFGRSRPRVREQFQIAVQKTGHVRLQLSSEIKPVPAGEGVSKLKKSRLHDRQRIPSLFQRSPRNPDAVGRFQGGPDGLAGQGAG